MKYQFSKVFHIAAIVSMNIFFSTTVGAKEKLKPVVIDNAESALVVGCANPVGIWVNQMNSKLQIVSFNQATGAISGQYQTASGAGGWFPMVGWINSLPAAPPKDNARIISFSVRWGAVGSITSWTGVCRGQNDLRTLWNLGRPNSEYEWDHILSGADNFKPETKGTEEVKPLP